MMRSATSAAWMPVAAVLEQDRELVAAQAGRGVGRAQGRLQALADLGQQLVARGVPERVVDRLEVVEVHEQDRDRLVGRAACARARGSTRSRNSARFASPVTGSWNAWCDSCSSNSLRSVMSRVLSTMPFTFGSCNRLVRSVSTKTQWPSLWCARNSIRPVCAVLAHRREERQHARLVLGADQVGEPRPFQLLGVVAEDARRGRARVPDGGVGLDDGHDVRGVPHQRGEALLALLPAGFLGEGGALDGQRRPARSGPRGRRWRRGCDRTAPPPRSGR